MVIMLMMTALTIMIMMMMILIMVLMIILMMLMILMMILAFYLYLGALWGPMGPQGGAKIPQNPVFTKRLHFNLFQKSGTLLKPKYLDFGAMRNLGISVFTKR